MFKSIEKLREKPEQTKRTIVLGITTLLFLVIIFAWLSILNIISVVNTDKFLEQKAKTPFSAMKKSVTSIFNDAKDQVDEIKVQF